MKVFFAFIVACIVVLASALDRANIAKQMSDRLGLTKLKQKDIEFKADINLRGADNMELEKVQTQAAGPQFAMLALFAPDSNCQGPIDVMMSLKLNTCEQMSGKFSRMVMYTGENNGELNLRMEIFANRNCRGAPIQVENNFGDLPAACDHGSFQGFIVNELPNLTDMSPHGVRAVVYDDKRKCRNDQKDYSNPPEESVNEMSYLTMGMCMGGFGKYKTDIEFVSCSVDEMGKQFFKLKIYKEGDNGKCKGSAMVVEKESGDFCNRSETFLDFYSGPLSWSCQQVTP